MPAVRSPRRRARRGAALVVALALVVLAGALLAGTHASARSAARTAQDREAMLVAEARSHTDAAHFIAQWDAASAGLVPGSELSAVMGPSPAGANGEIAATTLRLVRLDARRYLLATSTQVGPDDAVRARRRTSILLELPAVSDSTGPTPIPTPASLWALSRLY